MRLTKPLILPISTAACVLLAVASPVPADVEYELVIIEPWNTTYSLASSSVVGLNNLNQVTGCASPISGGCSFIWTLETGKTPINVAGPINDLGVITAAGYIRWPDGTLQEMDGQMGEGADLNNANVVVGANGGVHTCPVPPPWVDREATVWSPEGGTILVQQELGVWAADQAWAINEDNRFVGVRSSTGMCGDQKAFYYDLNTNEYLDLHMLLTGSSSGITHAFDINESGVVVGDGPHGGTVKPWLWTQGGGFEFLPPIPGGTLMDTHARAINNLGQVVGGGIVNDLEWHAFIWDAANGIRDLNTLVELPPNFMIDDATEINDNGWIIGSGHYGTWSPTRAVVLIPLAPAVPGDIDADGVVDMNDVSALTGVLIGADTDPARMSASDVNGDGTADGADVRALVEALIGS